MIRNMRSTQNINICCGPAEPVPLTLFTDDTDRRRFLQLLEQLPQDYAPLGERLPDTCTLYAYCLMSNHVHLLYRQGTEEVDQSMKRLESSD